MAEAPPRARRERLLHRPAVCPLELREQALPGVLRLTPHYLTDDGEIERLGEALEDCLRQRAAS